jgi:hypothetical protein
LTFLATNATPLNVNVVPCELATESTAEIDTLEAAVTPDGSDDRLDRADEDRETVAGVVPVAVRVNVAVYVAIRKPS